MTLNANLERKSLVITLATLWLVGFYLRLPILVTPPLSEAINLDFNLSQTLLGSLTTLPVFMLAAGALIGSFIITRLGARTSLAGALALVAVASAARGLGANVNLLFFFSLVMGLGIAIMQPALPAILGRWLQPKQIALGSAVYMNGLLMGEFVGAGLTLPVLMPWLSHSWQMVLVVWSLPAILVLGLIFIPKQHEVPQPHNTTKNSWMPDWSDPNLWRLGLLLSVSSSLFFGGNAYLSSFLTSRGEEHLIQAGFFLFNGAQVFASITMLIAARFWVAKLKPIQISLILSISGMVGMLAFDGWLSLFFGFWLSFWAGILLVLLVALPPQFASGAEAARLAAGAFTISYSLSFVMPLAGGALADYFAMPWLSLGFLVLISVPVIPLAWSIKLKAA